MARANLDRHVPAAGGPDIRGFEWWAYREKCEGDEERVIARHEAAVTTVAFSPDGACVASGSRDGKVLVQELESGATILGLPRDDAPNQVAEIPLMAAMIASSPEIREAVLKGDLKPDEVRMRGRPSKLGEIRALAFSPDGKRLATGCSGSYVRLWSFPEGTLQGLLPIRGCRHLEFNHDGTRLLTLEDEGGRFALHIHDVGSLTRLRLIADIEPAFANRAGVIAWVERGTLKSMDEDGFRILDEWPVGRGVGALAFSSDGKRLCGLAVDGRGQWLWSPAERREISPAEAPRSALRAVAARGDGFVTAGARQTLVMQATDDLGVRRELRGHEGEVLALAVSPDGRRLASGSVDRTARLWRVDGADPESEVGTRTFPRVVAHRADGSAWLSDGHDGRVLLGGLDGINAEVGGAGTRRALGFDAAGDLVATWSEEGEGGMRVDWWSSADASHRGSTRIDVGFPPPWTVDFREGRIAVTADRAEVRLFDAGTGRLHASLPDPGHGAARLVLGPDVRQVAACFWPRRIVVGTFGEGWGEGIEPNRGTLGPVAFSPDGRLLASGSDENLVVVHDVKSGAQVAALRGHREALVALTFTPDGRTLVSSSADRTLRLWHVATWRELGVLERGSLIHYLGFDRGGRHLITGAWDRPVARLPR